MPWLVWGAWRSMHGEMLLPPRMSGTRVRSSSDIARPKLFH